MPFPSENYSTYVTMPELNELLGRWGYMAIVLVVVLGNLGLPVPEETILGLAGYLVWRGDLRFSIVLVIGILSATGADNFGYWLGRRYGRMAIERYGAWLMLTPRRIECVERFVVRYGPFGIFVARFIPVLRFMAGPFAGAAGLEFRPFFVSNLLGSTLYVPLVVGLGYGMGYGLGSRIEKLRYLIGEVEYIVLAAAFFLTLALLGWRALRASRDANSFS